MNTNDAQVVAKIADHLRALAEQAAATIGEPQDTRSNQPSALEVFTNLELAKALLKLRRRRDRIFDGADLFGEPAWDMLLELYVSECEGGQISVSKLCIASGSAPTTALRHLSGLQATDMVAIRDDPFDKRRRFVSLTPSASEHIRRTLAGSIVTLAR